MTEQYDDDPMEEFEGEVHDIWTARAEFGYLASDDELDGIPVEGLMTMREQYPEIPEDSDDRCVVDILDSGILAAFTAIGVVTMRDGHGGFTITRADSDEIREARRLTALMANTCYQAARELTGHSVTLPDGPEENTRGAIPRALALYTEDAVMNKGVSLAEIDTWDDDEEVPWWKDLGWQSYSQWRENHRAKV